MATHSWMSFLRARHYGKAPIKEAIIDIQIDSPQSFSLESFTGLDKLIPPGYAERQNLMRNEILSQIEQGRLTATAKQDHLGYSFVGDEGKHVAQFRVNGFTFSRLAPYQTWDQFRSEAKRLWSIYRDLSVDPTITRIGLRYVNQLDLPMPIRDFRDFIRTYPEVSSDLPQLLSGFFLQLHLPQQDIDATLILNEAIVPASGPDVASIVLDIDLFRQGLSILDEGELWDQLEQLRVRKNMVFEGCITNKTRELIS